MSSLPGIVDADLVAGGGKIFDGFEMKVCDCWMGILGQ